MTRRPEGGRASNAVGCASPRMHRRSLPKKKSWLGVALGLGLGAVLAGGCSSGFGSSCTTKSDCASNERCEFKVGSCSAPGLCTGTPSGPQCGAEIEYCGCDGAPVQGGCGYLDGYASGPTLG